MTILVTGGAGFIGSNFILEWFKSCDEPLLNVDKLSYAANLLNLESVKDNPSYYFIKGDILDRRVISQLLNQHKPRLVVHFAAESHVDKSISNPTACIQTNILGTFHLLDSVLKYWRSQYKHIANDFCFLHISTDEVYGSLDKTANPRLEKEAYAPNSPYSASKASSDHLVRAYHQTYGLPVIVTHTSNNYGPYQYPEKLIPLVIYNALSAKIIPIYGDGQQIRDWIYVKDHIKALNHVIERGKVGECYNISGQNQLTNLTLVNTICDILDRLKPRSDGASFKKQIKHINDRPGHDRRYDLDSKKIKALLGFTPTETIETGLSKTIKWYLDNKPWLESTLNEEYKDWIQRQYA